VVDLVVAAAREAGLDVVGAGPSGPGRLAELSLLPGEIRIARQRAARSGLRRLGMVVLATWLLLGSAYALMLRLERGKVDRERATLAGGVAALSGLRREVRGAEQMLRVVDNAERGRGRVLSQVGRLVSALPDSAFLSSLLVSRDGSALIAGHALRASEVLAALTRSAAVAPRFEGPILKETAAGRQWEGFTIRLGAAPQ